MTRMRIHFLLAPLCATLALAADPTAPTPLVTQSPDKLVAILKSEAGRKEKADACRELAVVGNSSTLPANIKSGRRRTRLMTLVIPGSGISRGTAPCAREMSTSSSRIRASDNRAGNESTKLTRKTERLETR